MCMYRYEVESDENRRKTAFEIGRRYLGIVNEIKAIDQEIEKTEPNNITQNNVSSPKNNSQQISEKIDGQSMHNDNEENNVDAGDAGDLVIDILNDELISPVKQKIHSKLKSSGTVNLC